MVTVDSELQQLAADLKESRLAFEQEVAKFEKKQVVLVEKKTSSEEQKLRKGDLKLIAEATNLGWHIVSMVSQGLRSNEVVTHLIDLAKTDRLAFAQMLATEKNATDTLLGAGLLQKRASVYYRKKTEPTAVI